MESTTVKMPATSVVRQGRRAFTMGELLITVAVVAMLASLLIPGLQSARRKTMEAAGMSNLRQLATAQQLYAGENNGNFTPTWYYDNTATWRIRLAPYLGYDISKHPAWDSAYWNPVMMDPKTIFNVPDSAPASKRVNLGSSVFINGWMQPSYSGGSNWNFRLLAVPRPAETILLGEYTPETNGDTMPGPPSTFTRGGRSKPLMAFCDGHVEALSLNELSLSAGNRPGLPNRWNWWNP